MFLYFKLVRAIFGAVEKVAEVFIYVRALLPNANERRPKRFSRRGLFNRRSSMKTEFAVCRLN